VYCDNSNYAASSSWSWSLSSASSRRAVRYNAEVHLMDA
jgi:hypothetical protein